jgi:pimeloyl-ACP methyl ester carboxylesterase
LKKLVFVLVALPIFVTVRNASSLEHRYEVWRSATNDLDSAVRANTDYVQGTQFLDTTVQPDTPYYYWVRGVDTQTETFDGYCTLSFCMDLSFTSPTAADTVRPSLVKAVVDLDKGLFSFPSGTVRNEIVAGNGVVKSWQWHAQYFFDSPPQTFFDVPIGQTQPIGTVNVRYRASYVDGVWVPTNSIAVEVGGFNAQAPQGVQAKIETGGVRVSWNPASNNTEFSTATPIGSRVVPGIPDFVPDYTGNDRLYLWSGGQDGQWSKVTSGDGIALDQPTVVIVHGWHGKIDDQHFVDMAKEFDTLRENSCANCNILAWDWQDEANPLGLPHQLLEIPVVGLEGAAAAIRNGSNQGKLLARELNELGLSPDRIQLIGHSAGAAVIGGAASSTLAITVDQKIKRLTLLDAPQLQLDEIPEAVFGLEVLEALGLPATHVSAIQNTYADALKFVDDETAQQVEVYHASGDDNRLLLGFGGPLPDRGSPNVFNAQLAPDASRFDVLDCIGTSEHCGMHSEAPEWYYGNRIQSSIFYGNGDNFIPGNFIEQLPSTGIFNETAIAEKTGPSLREIARETFETASTWSGTHALPITGSTVGLDGIVMRVFENSDGYLYREIALPSDAEFLTFDLAIENAGDGDYLTVSLGPDVLYYEELGLFNESGFQTVKPIFVGDHAGTTATLLFALRSVGDANASVLLDNISFLFAPLPGDFDHNGVVDGNDYGTWKANFGSVSELAADGNSDGVVDAADYTVWRNNLGAGVTSPKIPGDFNGDEIVNAADYTVWRNGLGSTFTSADYEVWKSHFGQTTTGASAGVSTSHSTVPEPASLMHVVIALMCILRRTFPQPPT